MSEREVDVKCASCGVALNMESNEDEMWEEYDRLFGEGIRDSAVRICHDCWCCIGLDQAERATNQ